MHSSQTTEIRKERKVQVTREYHMQSSSSRQSSIDNFSGDSSFPALNMSMPSIDSALQNALQSADSDIQSLLSDNMSSALNQSALSSSLLSQSQKQQQRSVSTSSSVSSSSTNQSQSQHQSLSSSSNSNNNSNQIQKFTETIALGGNIGPDDLSVSLKGDIVTIEAKVQKEKRCEDGSMTSTSKMYQEFKKSFTLPANVDASQLKTVLTADGNLRIEAPVQQRALPAP